jgi:hypothetical protein
MKKGPWIQKQVWVRYNENGVIVDYSEKLPGNEDFIPTVPFGLKSDKPKKKGK